MYDSRFDPGCLWVISELLSFGALIDIVLSVRGHDVVDTKEMTSCLYFLRDTEDALSASCGRSRTRMLLVGLSKRVLDTSIEPLVHFLVDRCDQ